RHHRRLAAQSHSPAAAKLRQSPAAAHGRRNRALDDLCRRAPQAWRCAALESARAGGRAAFRQWPSRRVLSHHHIPYVLASGGGVFRQPVPVGNFTFARAIGGLCMILGALFTAILLSGVQWLTFAGYVSDWGASAFRQSREALPSTPAESALIGLLLPSINSS